MTSPNIELMNHYGTQAVYQQKLAGAASLTERLVGGLAGFGLAAHNRQDNARAAQQGAMMSEMLRELELLRIDPAAQLLRGTPVPRFTRPRMPFRDMPQGGIDDGQWNRDLDDGTVRLASIAARAGADLAKEAGLGDFAGFAKGLASKAVGALGALKPAATAATGAATQGIAGAAKSAIAPPGGAGGAGGLLAKGKELLGGKLGLGVKGNLALAGMAAGGLYLGNKAIQKGTQAMGSEAGPATYGGGSHGYRLPMTVNADGQPQL